MKTQLEGLIRQTVAQYAQSKGFAVPEPLEVDLVVTKDPSHGDLATNIAFKISKPAQSKPFSIAQELLPFLQKAAAQAPFIAKMEVAGGGFINFYLTKDSLGAVLVEVLKKDKNYGRSEFGKGKKVLVEFVSANPTGPLTIAHGRQAAIGDSLARILQATGHEVQKEYYLNDGGRQMNLLGASLYARYCQALGKDEPLPEEGYQGEYLKETAQQLIAVKKDSLLKEKKETAMDFCRVFAGDTIMKGIIEDMKAIQVVFDSYFNESSLYKNGNVEKSLQFLKERGFLYEHEGALWFRTTDFGDDKDRVVKKSSGEFTYLAPDIAYHHEKFNRGFNKLINLLGPDHHGYIVRLKAACQALGHDADVLNVLIVQLTSLFRKGQPVRMSTRAGEFVTLHELVQEVGPDAARFFFVMRKYESHLDFDLDLAKEKTQDNPVYYMQYAHARICSLIKKIGRPISVSAKVARLTTPEETELIKAIGEFSVALVRASEANEPYKLVDYLRELAANFHKFYSFHRIKPEDTQDAELSDARLLLADATRIVLRNGLALLGVSQPESM